MAWGRRGLKWKRINKPIRRERCGPDLGFFEANCQPAGGMQGEVGEDLLGLGESERGFGRDVDGWDRREHGRRTRTTP